MNHKAIQRNLEAAIALQNAEKFDEAEKIYAQVRKAAPRLYDAWYLSGTAAFQRGGNLVQAVEFLTRAQRLDPRAPACKLFLGMALADSGKYAEAEKPLRAALEKLPDHPEAWENLAKCLVEQGKRDEAADCLSNLLSRFPDRAAAREQLESLTSAHAAALSVHSS